MVRFAAVALAVAAVADSAVAGIAIAEAPMARPRVTIDAASWLAGRWVGEGLGGELEEIWSPSRHGQMVGHFLLAQGGKPVLYEMMLLDEHEGGLRMRVKHFNPDFVGWEERTGWHAFDPAHVGAGDLRFDGARFRLEGDALVATVTVRDRSGGPARDHVLRLRRAPL